MERGQTQHLLASVARPALVFDGPVVGGGLARNDGVLFNRFRLHIAVGFCGLCDWLEGLVRRLLGDDGVALGAYGNRAWVGSELARRMRLLLSQY